MQKKHLKKRTRPRLNTVCNSLFISYLQRLPSRVRLDQSDTLIMHSRGGGEYLIDNQLLIVPRNAQLSLFIRPDLEENIVLRITQGSYLFLHAGTFLINGVNGFLAEQID